MPKASSNNGPHRFVVALSDLAFETLNAKFPASRSSNDIGKRAVEIVKVHFASIHPGCRFPQPPKGADLSVLASGDLKPTPFEVKGTADADIAWQQLKVSSRTSYELLVNGGAAVLRVTDVFGRKPAVYELRHGRDFKLEPEPRWCVKPVRA